jgi:hypothetical protein
MQYHSMGSRKQQKTLQSLDESRNCAAFVETEGLLLCQVSTLQKTPPPPCNKIVSIPDDVKYKAIPVTGRGGLQGCEMLGIPHCLLHSRLTDGGKVFSLSHLSRSSPQKH